jgi:hypothetical protein
VPLDPNALDLFAPAGLKNFVYVQANTYIKITGNKSQSSIPSEIKAPWRYANVVDHCAMFACLLWQPVIGSGVGNQDQIGIFRRRAETLNEVRFVLADRVDTNL